MVNENAVVAAFKTVLSLLHKKSDQETAYRTGTYRITARGISTEEATKEIHNAVAMKELIMEALKQMVREEKKDTTADELAERLAFYLSKHGIGVLADKATDGKNENYITRDSGRKEG